MMDVLEPGKYTSESRFMKIDSSLGDDVLLLRSLTGVEGLSKLPQFQLDVLSYTNNIDPVELIGDLLKIKIDHEDSDVKLVSGYVNEFQHKGPNELGLYTYNISIVPWYWFLKKRINYRVFQNVTVQDIFEEICGPYDFANYTFSLSKPLKPLLYCVQYGESDFDFLNRLLESAGIFYYFGYDTAGHTLHLTDSNGGLVLAPTSEVTNSLDGKTKLRDWRHQYRYCSSKVSVSDYDYEKPKYSLHNETSSVLKLKNAGELSQYLYPGSFKESEQGEDLAKLLMEQNESGFDGVTAWSECRQLGVGNKFTYTNSSGGADNGKVFVVTEIEHEAIDNSYNLSGTTANSYKNTIVCIPEKYQFRSKKLTPKPRIDGVQTALVVGKSGDEIYTDSYGRIKIQFHWDMYGAKNENSSCWVRVATPWAGTKWGSVSLPRVGQEVIVTFEEGDPDRPLVMGCVYNNTHMPPYDLPGQKNIQGVKSRSTKGGDKTTYNEISFDDTNGSEALTINAQKDYSATIGNNATTSVAASASTSTGSNYSLSVGENATESVTKDKTVSVDGKQDVTIGKESTTTVTGKVTLTGNKGAAITISGGDTSITFEEKLTETINGDTAINRKKSALTIDGDDSYHVTGSQTLNVDADQKINAKSQESIITNLAKISAADIELSASSSLTLSVGGHSIEISATGIKISSSTSVEIGVNASSIAVDNVGVRSSGAILKVN